MIDVDHFKEYNDRYSYNDGDRVIYLVSRILHDVVKVKAFPWAEFPHKVGLHNGCTTLRALREAYKIVFRSGLTVGNALDRVSTELPLSKELSHFVDFCRKSERGIAR